MRAAISAAACACLTLAASCVDIVGPDTGPPVPAGGASTPRDSTPAPSLADTSTLRIVVSTSGTDPDPDGYTLELWPAAGAISVVLPATGSVDVRVRAGTYRAKLLDVAGNCAVGGQPWWGSVREFQVPRSAAGQPPTYLSFTVSCEQTPTERLAPGTHLAFVRDGRIWRVGSDGSDPIQLTAGAADADPAWSPDGRRIAFARSESRDQWGTPINPAIYIMDADGSNVVRLTEKSYNRQPTWSPDGRRLAFQSFCPSGIGSETCVLVASADPSDTSRTRVGWPRGYHDSPAWSPDGSRIAFTSDWVAFDFVRDLYFATVGTSAIVLVTNTALDWDVGDEFYQPAWSPDGRYLAVVVCPPAYFYCDSSDVGVMNADGGGDVRRLVRTRGFARPTWSPDGRTIAFAAAGSIQWVSADGSARGLIVADGESPSWRP